MRKLLLFLSVLIASQFTYAQSVLPFRADTIKIQKVGGYAELVLQNKTKDTTGFLYNVGGGRTEFRRIKKVSDSIYVFGVDTIKTGTPGGTATVTTKNPITKAGDSVAINIDATALAVKGNKLISKIPVIRRMQNLRGIATADLDTSFVYKVNIDGEYGEFLYRPGDSTPEDSAINIRTDDDKLIQRVITDGWINAKWFGVKADGTTDDTYALQRCVNWVLGQNKYRKIELPEGTIKITNGIMFFKDANNDGFPEFINIEIRGAANSHGVTGNIASTVIYSEHNDNFAFGIQFGKGIRISNIAFRGSNNLSSLSIQDVYSGNPSLFITGGARSNRYSPYSAIVIDPIHSLTSSEDRYPRMTGYYTGLVNTETTGSTDIVISNVFVQHYVAGIIFSPNGHSQNAEACVIKDSWIDHCKDAVVNAQSQTRENEVKNLKVWGRVHTVFNCTSYGEGNGVMPNVDGVNIAGYNYQLMQLTNGWSNASFNNVYAETLYRLGYWGSSTTGLPVSFVNSYFDIPTGQYYTSSRYITGEALFTGCTIRQYNGKTGFITSNGNNLTFINCQLSGPVVPYRDVLDPPQANKIVGKVKYINCNAYGLPIAGAFGKIESELNEHSNRLGYYPQSVYGVKKATIIPPIFGEQVNPANRQPLPFNYRYELSGELQQAMYADGEGGVTVKFNASNGSAYFVSSNPSRYVENDIVAQLGISATVDGEEGITSTILGVVENISNDTVYLTSVVDINPGSTDKTGVTIIAYQHSEFQEPFVGTITEGSNTITNVRFHQRLKNIKLNTTIQHPAFPFFTRITAINFTTKTVTLSKEAISSDPDGVIELSRLTGSGSAAQSPNTINYTSYPNFDSAFSVVLKGSFITNVGTDTTIQGWMCTRTGFLGTSRPPVFKKILAVGDTLKTVSIQTTGQSGYDNELSLDELGNKSFITKKMLQDRLGSLIIQPDIYLGWGLAGENTVGDPIQVDTTALGLAPKTYVDYKIDSLAAAGEAGDGLTVVDHDETLLGDGTNLSPLKVDTNIVATKDALQNAIDSLSNEVVNPDGSETIIIDGVGYTVTGIGTAASPYKLTITGTPSSNPLRAISLYDYGFQGDAVAGAGNYATGTNNTNALASAIAAAQENQIIIVPPNGLFSTPLDTIGSSKTLNIWFLGRHYQAGNKLFIFKHTGGAFKNHRIFHSGEAIDRINQPTHSKATHDAGTQPNWAAMTGVFVTYINISQIYIEMNRVVGFKTPVEALAGYADGSQENTIKVRVCRNCAVGAWMQSLDGNSYNDKTDWHFKRFSGGLAVKIDGYAPAAAVNGEIYNGAFRSNEFHMMIEQADSIAEMHGDITYVELNTIVEGGPFTGVFGTGIRARSISPNYVYNPKYTGLGYFEWKHINGTGTAGMGINGWIEKPIWNGGANLAHRAIIDESGRIGCFAPVGLSKSNRDAAGGNFYFINPFDKEIDTTITASTYTVGARVKWIRYNNTSGTLTFPAASTNVDRIVHVDNISDNNLSVINVDSTTIPGKQKQAYKSDGVTWRALYNFRGSGSVSSGSSQWIDDGSNIRYPNKVSIGGSTAGASLDLKAKNTPSVAGSGLLKVRPQQLLDAAETGLVENDGSDFYVTPQATRYKLIHTGNITQYQQKYQLVYSQIGNTPAITSTSYGSLYKDGSQTLTGATLAAGDIIELSGFGSTVTGGSSPILNIQFTIGSTVYVAAPSSPMPTTTSSVYSYTGTVKILTTGTSGTAVAIFKVKFTNSSTEALFPTNVTLNTINPAIAVSASWNSSGHSVVANDNNIEIKRQ